MGLYSCHCTVVCGLFLPFGEDVLWPTKKWSNGLKVSKLLFALLGFVMSVFALGPTATRPPLHTNYIFSGPKSSRHEQRFKVGSPLDDPYAPQVHLPSTWQSG